MSRRYAGDRIEFCASACSWCFGLLGYAVCWRYVGRSEGPDRPGRSERTPWRVDMGSALLDVRALRVRYPETRLFVNGFDVPARFPLPGSLSLSEWV